MITTFLVYAVCFYLILSLTLKKASGKVLIIISLLITLIFFDYLPYISILNGLEKIITNSIPRESMGYIMLLYGIFIYYALIIILFFLLIYLLLKKKNKFY